jgi:hypothetical protein
MKGKQMKKYINVLIVSLSLLVSACGSGVEAGEGKKIGRAALMSIGK